MEINCEYLAECLREDIENLLYHGSRGGKSECSPEYGGTEFYIEYEWKAHYTEPVPNYIDGLIESWSSELTDIDINITYASYGEDNHVLAIEKIIEIEKMV